MTDMETARGLLESGEYTCVIARGGEVHTATQRGVKPLLAWVEEGRDFSGFCAADRVVGRGAAFLYCLLRVERVYAQVMSTPAARVLEAYGIAWECGREVSGIINRRGDGPCPFEAAVMDISGPEDALAAIRAQMAAMK